MSLSGMSSGPHGQTSATAHGFNSTNMSNEVYYKSWSLHKSVYIALQRDHFVCFGSHSGSPVDPVLCNVTGPGNSSQFCGGDSWYTFRLRYPWVAPVETICSGMSEPVGNNVPMYSTVCLDDFNEIVPCISTCPSGQHLASYEPVWDPLWRKWVVRQRCFGIEHAGVSRVAHAEVQFLCQKWTGWCDIKHVEGYTIASNTSKCKAVEFMSELAIRIGNVNCTFKSCDVPPSFVNTLHSSVERYFPDTVICSRKSGYSQNELCYGKEEFFSGCMTDCIHDVAHLVSLPINFIIEDAPIAKTIEFPDEVVFVDGDWNKYSAVLEQKDLLGAVSFFVADDAVPNSEVLNVAETETVEGEVVVNFPAMDADRKNDASLRKVVIEEVLVPVVDLRPGAYRQGRPV